MFQFNFQLANDAFTQLYNQSLKLRFFFLTSKVGKCIKEIEKTETHNKFESLEFTHLRVMCLTLSIIKTTHVAIQSSTKTCNRKPNRLTRIPTWLSQVWKS